MLSKKEFIELRKEIDKDELQREKLISKSREVIKLSKKLIYAVHRNQKKKAEYEKKKLESAFKEVKKLGSDGPYKIAAQEYVEAIAYFHYFKTGKLPERKSLNVEAENYLLGLGDLSGELSRRAVNAVIKENYKEFHEIRDLVANLYQEMLLFDFRNNELRRKVDSMKYEVKKLEDISLQLKLKEK